MTNSFNNRSLSKEPEPVFHEGVLDIRPSAIHEKGVFATSSIARETAVFSVVPGLLIQPILSINHACAPNCRVHRAVVYAARNIERGEELTIDYRTIRFPIHRLEFDCTCGDLLCAHHIEVGQ